MATFRDDAGSLIEVRQVTPSTRRPDSPYAVEVKAYNPGLEQGIAVLLTPEDAIRFAVNLIQSAESVRDEQAFVARQPRPSGHPAWCVVVEAHSSEDCRR